MTYKFINVHTNHVFCQSDDLKEVLQLYHKVPRRKRTDLLIVDTTTGEMLRLKRASINQVEEVV